MAVNVVGQYRYYYGAGSEPNREIQFQKKEETESPITAVVYAIVPKTPEIPDGKKEISRLSDDQITVEIMSTSDKLKRFMAKRNGEAVDCSQKDREALSNLTSEKQEALIKNLQPKGTWRLEIVNDIGENPRFEKVSYIGFFNPS